MNITLKWDSNSGDGKRAFVVAEQNDGWQDLRIEVDTDDCDRAHAKAAMQEVINRCNNYPAIQAGGWVKIAERLPKEGDVIVCSAEHRAGGPMFWAGHIVETKQGFAVMETRGVPPERFILTHDTVWLPLPALPNV